MKIDEATRIALESDGYIRRKSESVYPVYIRPTDLRDVCMELIVVDPENQTEVRCRWWHPTASDLMADDWEVLLDDKG